MQKILAMAIMMAVGAAAGKLKVLTLDMTEGLSRMCLYIISPCLFISSLQVDVTTNTLHGILVTFLGAVLVHIIVVPLTHLAALKIRMKPVEIDSLIYPNAGNLILPLVTYILGKEYVVYCCAFLVVQTILLWTHGVYIMGGRSAVSIKKIVLNPNIIAIAVGVILFFTGIRLPDVLETAVEGIGNMVGPIAMIITGIIIANSDLKAVFTDKKAYLTAAGRLLILPALCILGFKVTGLYRMFDNASAYLVVTALAASGPSASNITLFSRLFNKDYETASAINIMTIIACIVTMPIMIGFYQIMCV